MGVTKKRRQTKHRGNAAGMVESRGRTGAREGSSSSTGGKQQPTGPREPKPASWQRAATKALIPVVILIPVLIFTNKGKSPTTAIPLIALAYVVYVPLSYYSDMWVYNRFQKKKKQS